MLFLYHKRKVPKGHPITFSTWWLWRKRRKDIPKFNLSPQYLGNVLYIFEAANDLYFSSAGSSIFGSASVRAFGCQLALDVVFVYFSMIEIGHEKQIVHVLAKIRALNFKIWNSYPREANSAIIETINKLIFVVWQLITLWNKFSFYF